jgi:phosphocarrier protein HPr
MASAAKNKESGASVVRDLIIGNKLGLHARPAAMFVRVANRFASDIQVEKDGEEINGKSIMGLMLLAAGCGSRLKVTVTGGDAERDGQGARGINSSQIRRRVSNLAPMPDETSEPPTPAQQKKDTRGLPSLPASPSARSSPLRRRAYHPQTAHSAGGCPGEITRFEAALLKTRQQIQAIRNQLASSIGEADASIFDAHILLLEDTSLIESVKEQVPEPAGQCRLRLRAGGPFLHAQDARARRRLFPRTRRGFPRCLAPRAAQSAGQGGGGTAQSRRALHRPGARSLALRHGGVRPQAGARHRHRGGQPHVALGHHGAVAEPARGGRLRT